MRMNYTPTHEAFLEAIPYVDDERTHIRYEVIEPVIEEEDGSWRISRRVWIDRKLWGEYNAETDESVIHEDIP